MTNQSEPEDYQLEDQTWWTAVPASKEAIQDNLADLAKQVDLVIITASDVQRDAVLRLLKPLNSARKILNAFVGLETYHIGKFGVFVAAVTKCQVLSVDPSAAKLAVTQALIEWRPRVLIMVGLAFARDPEKHKPADVLVATEIISYEQHMGVAGVESRGAISPRDHTLLNRLDSAINWNFCRPNGSQCNKYAGVILSGEKLAYAPSFNTSLFEAFPDAIGVEFEGAWMCASAILDRVPWIFVKAVCDCADTREQLLAAAAAASLIHHVMLQATVLNGLEKKEGPVSQPQTTDPASRPSRTDVKTESADRPKDVATGQVSMAPWLQPLAVLRESIKAVPMNSYALGVVGIVAAASASILLTGESWRKALAGGIAVFIGMVILRAFAENEPNEATPQRRVSSASTFLTWVCLFAFAVVVCMLVLWFYGDLFQTNSSSSIARGTAVSMPETHYESVGSLQAKLPNDQRRNFEKQAYAKAATPTPSALKVEKLVTLFFEVPLTKLSARKEWTGADRKHFPGFLKIQVITYDPSASGSTRIKALFSPSSDSADRCRQEVYRFRKGDKLTDVPADGDPDGGMFKAVLSPGDQVVVVVSYDGWLLDGPLGDPTANWRRDWHMVEVSDFAAKGSIHYLFATGSMNYKISSLQAYDFKKNKEDRLDFEQHNLAVPDAFGATLQDKLLQVIHGIREKGDFKDHHAAGLDFLASSQPSEGFVSIPWVGEERTEQSSDTAYITETKGDNRQQ